MIASLRKILRTDYIRNIGLTGGGALLTALMGVVVSPIVSRIFTPEEYGTAGLYTQSMSYIGLLGGLTLTSAIVVVRRSSVLYRLISGLKYLYLISFVSLLVLIYLGKDMIQQLLNDNSDGWWLWLLPFGFVVGQMIQVIRSLNIRAEFFGLNAKSQVAGNFVQRGLILIGGYWSRGYYLWLIVAPLVNILPYFFLLKKKSITKFIRIPARSSALRQTLRDLKDYPRYLLPGNLLGILASTAPFFIFTIQYGPKEAGLFLFAMGMLSLPIQFTAGAVSPVYLREISTSFHENRPLFLARTRSTNYLLFFAGVLPYSILTVFGPEIFVFVFGSQWKLAGQMGQYMCFFLLLRMAIFPLAGLFRVAEKERIAFQNQVVMSVLRILPLAVGLQYALEWGLLGFGVGSSLGYLYYFYQHCKISGLPFWRVMGGQVIIFLFLVITCYGLRWLIM